MRVLVASDAIGGLDSSQASDVLARAFHAQGAQVAVISLVREVAAPVTFDDLSGALAAGADVVDLSRFEFDREHTPAVRGLVEGRSCTGIVDDAEVDLPLTGISGYAVQASRAAGEDLALGLAADAAATSWLQTVGLDDGPGAGARGGLGALWLAGGNRLVDRLSWAMEVSRFREVAAQADVVVTGCTDLDFHARGGPLVQRVVAVAEEVLRPVIVVAARNFVSARELRLAGIEAAYPVWPGAEPGDVTTEQLERVADGVAQTWRF